jgi:predicted phosphodiesterase
VYKGQEFFLKCIGSDQQADYVVENYPRIKGVTTSYILGNHDMSHYDREGADIGRLIDAQRPDMKCLGQYYARVKFDNITLDLVHPHGGFSYAISYPLQRYVNELEGGSKANVLAMGHFHRTMYTVYRNIHCLLAGAFQDQNDYTRRRGLQPNKGFWILEFEGDNKGIINFKPEWHAYYELADARIVRQMKRRRR